MEVPEERHAPLAPGARAETIADQRGHGGIFAFEERADLPQRDVETEADIVVGIHRENGKAAGPVGVGRAGRETRPGPPRIIILGGWPPECRWEDAAFSGSRQTREWEPCRASRPDNWDWIGALAARPCGGAPGGYC